MLTVDYLKEIIHYNPETGIFTWILARPKIRAGQIAGYKTHKNRIEIEIHGKAYQASRLAVFYMTGEWPRHQVDHINCIKTDNRIKNLRPASAIENGQNKKIQKNNKSGFKNVHWCKTHKKWVVTIKVNKKTISIGNFKDVELADLVAQEARNKYHKSFANHG